MLKNDAHIRNERFLGPLLMWTVAHPGRITVFSMRPNANAWLKLHGRQFVRATAKLKGPDT